MRNGWIHGVSGKRIRVRFSHPEKREKNTGIRCPNWRNCGETSLSVSWMVRLQAPDTLSCFQCDTEIGEWVPDAR